MLEIALFFLPADFVVDDKDFDITFLRDILVRDYFVSKELTLPLSVPFNEELIVGLIRVAWERGGWKVPLDLRL